MKTLVGSFILLFTAMFCLVTLANAGPYQTVQGFNNYSSQNGVTSYSPVIPVYGYRTKTLQVQGTVMADKTDTTLAGTLLAQGSATKTGPWFALQNEAGTAISTTANKIVQWTDSVNYIRLSWTRSASCRVKAWLSILQ